jgi:hypothetical protein
MTHPKRHTYNGQQYTTTDLARMRGCNVSTMRKRIAAMGVQRAMDEPILTYGQAAQRAGKAARRNASNPFNRFRVGWR